MLWVLEFGIEKHAEIFPHNKLTHAIFKLYPLLVTEIHDNIGIDDQDDFHLATLQIHSLHIFNMIIRSQKTPVKYDFVPEESAGPHH